MNALTNILNRREKASPKSERTLVREYFKELSQGCSLKEKKFLHDAASTLPESLQLWNGVVQVLEELNINPLHFEFVPSHIQEEIENSIKDFSKLAQRRAIRINRISTHIMDAKFSGFLSGYPKSHLMHSLKDSKNYG